MASEAWRDRIVCDAGLHGGEPCIRDTRIPVAVVVASLADVSHDELLKQDPQLSREDFQAALYYAADKGSGDLRAYPPGTHAGIILLRPDRESIVEFRNLVEDLLNKHTLDSLAGRVTVAVSRSVRIRRQEKPQ
ncbi:MAG TPA: DUF433 domain-containing protein [Phycisphaerae bacterium]|nr:DUF433 domain-containing protein [Phycisphaerae bacterium]